MVLAANASGSLNALTLGFICLKAVIFDRGGSFQVCIYLVFIITLTFEICSAKLFAAYKVEKEG